MIFEFILLFLALCFLVGGSSPAGLFFAAVAAAVTAFKANRNKDEAERLRREIADLKAEFGREIIPLKRQVQFLSEQLATLRPARHDEAEGRPKPAAALAAEPIHPKPAVPPLVAPTVPKPAEPAKPATPTPPPPVPAAPTHVEPVKVLPSDLAAHVSATPPASAAATPPQNLSPHTSSASTGAKEIPQSVPTTPTHSGTPVAPAHDIPAARKPDIAAATPLAPEQKPAEQKEKEEKPKISVPPAAVPPVLPVTPASPTLSDPQKPAAPPPPPPPPVTEAPIAARIQTAGAQTTGKQSNEAQKPAAMRQTPPVAAYSRPAAPAAPPVPRAPRPSLIDRLKWLLAFEDRLGADWAAKIGIVLLVFGFTLLGLYEFKNLANWGKVALFYALTGTLLGAGIFAEKRERYKILGRTAIGGGWALFFFTTFAMQYVHAMQVLHNLVLDSVLLLAVAVAMVIHTLRYRSQVVTGFAFLLAYSTIVLSQNAAHNQPTGVIFYSLGAGVILTLGIVTISARMHWFELEIFGILSSYLAHFYWLYTLLGPRGAHGTMFPEFYPSGSILLSYWAIYRASYLMRGIRNAYEEHVSSFAAVLNTGLLLTALRFQSVHKDLAFFALLILGITEFGLAQLPITRKRRLAFILLTVLGTSLAVAAVPFRYAAEPGKLALLWLVAAEVFLVMGVVAREVVYRRLGKLIGVAVAIHMTLYSLPELLKHGYPIHDFAPGIYGEGAIFLIAGFAFQANYFFAASKWREYFSQKIDELLSVLLSYAGCAAISVGLWAVLAPHWTLVASASLMTALAFGGRRFQMRDASLQATVIGICSFLWAIFLRTYHVPGNVQNLYFTVVSVVLASALFYVASWQIWSANARRESMVRLAGAWLGTILLWVLIYARVDFAWRAGVLLILAAMLAEAGVRLQYRPLVWHVHALVACAVFLGVFYDYDKFLPWRGIAPKFFTPIVAAALVYWLAKRTGDIARLRAALVRDLNAWAATIVAAMLIARQAPSQWMACEWLGYGIALALIGRRTKLASLCYQECALAVLAVGRTCWLFGSPDTKYGAVSVQLLTVSLVAGGLYFISRRSYLEGNKFNRSFAYGHTWAATFLLAALAWEQAPQFAHGWFAAIVALFALILALVGRQFDIAELPWQAHVLSAVAALSAAGIDLEIEDRFHGLPVRLLSISTVVAALYLIGIVVPLGQAARRYKLHVAYTLVPVALLAALLAYQLPREWVAASWLAYGIVLTFLGRYWKRADLCYEEVGLAAAAVCGTLAENFGIEKAGWGFLSLRFVTVGLVAAGLYAISRFSSVSGVVPNRDDIESKISRWIAYAHTWAASSLLALLAWYEAPQHGHGWFAAILAIFAIVLAIIDRQFEIGEFGWQAQALSGAAFLAAGAIDLTLNDKFHGVSIRLLASLAVLCALYGLSVVLRAQAQTTKTEINRIYTWAAMLLGSTLAWYELQPHPEWIAVALLGYGIVLALAGRFFKRLDLCWQEIILAAASVGCLFAFNYRDGDLGILGPISIRVLTVGIVAAGLYFASRRCYLEETDANRWIAYAHTWAATIALAALCYKDAPDAWLSAILAAFALLLSAADRYWETTELKWQAHLLAAASLVFVAVNDVPRMSLMRSQANGRVPGLTVPFLASLVVVLCLYLLSPLLRFTEEQRKRNLHHLYTWPASVLGAALIWYGVNETGVAIGWALFGVILFWTGLQYGIEHLRYQAYVALVSAFVRIFFVDLTAMPITVLVIAAILYFVHAMLRSDVRLAAKSGLESRLKLSALLAYLGTASLGALCYYKFHKDLAPIAWAVMVLLLLAAALWLRYSVYLHQAMLFTVGIFCYGMIYNLNRLWRTAPLVIAIAIMLLGLPVAYRLRRMGINTAEASRSRFVRLMQMFVYRPEQVLFFSAIVLMTFTMTRWTQTLITFGWGVEGIIVYVIALLMKERSFRYTGEAVVLLALGKLVAHDAWIGTSPLTRILTVIGVGMVFLLVAFFHGRYSEKFKEWI